MKDIKDKITIAHFDNRAYPTAKNRTRIVYQYFDDKNEVYFDGSIFVDFVVKKEDKAKRLVANKLMQITK